MSQQAFREYCAGLIPNIPADLMARMADYATKLGTTDWASDEARQGIQLLHSDPWIWHIPGFLTPEECEHIKQLSQGRLTDSRVLDSAVEDPTIRPYRTSRQLFLPLYHDLDIARIETRIACLLQIPFEYGDGLQVLNYQVGQEYKPHHDYFYIDRPSGQKAMAISGQRTLTLLLYLNTVAGGGETAFPELDLTFKPQQGGVLMFGNLHADRSPDPRTLHASLPVTAGEKWVATKWIHTENFMEALSRQQQEDQ